MSNLVQYRENLIFCLLLNAAVNGHLELPLLKDRQRFRRLTSNLEVLNWKFRDCLTYFIFGHGESSLNNFWSMVNVERCVLFYYFLCLKANLDLEKTNQLGESSPNYFRDGESWPNYFGKGVIGESWPNFCWKGEQRFEVGRFKMVFDACIRVTTGCF